MMVMSPLDDPIGRTIVARLRPYPPSKMFGQWRAITTYWRRATAFAFSRAGWSFSGESTARRFAATMFWPECVGSDAQLFGRWLIRLDVLAASVGRTPCVRAGPGYVPLSYPSFEGGAV